MRKNIGFYRSGQRIHDTQTMIIFKRSIKLIELKNDKILVRDTIRSHRYEKGPTADPFCPIVGKKNSESIDQ